MSCGKISPKILMFGNGIKIPCFIILKKTDYGKSVLDINVRFILLWLLFETIFLE
jgi:hypothetical protein